MMGFSSLTIICFSKVFADKRHVAPHLSLVNVNNLNEVLRSEVFVNEDRQLRAVHLILDFQPISDIFQEMGHAIKVGDPRLHRIDVSILGFLAREDIMPAGIPLVLTLPEAATPREGTAFSRLSLEEEIDQFYLEEEKEDREAQVIPISDVEDEFDRLSGVRTPVIVVARPDSSSKEEEDMAMNPRRGLRDLFAGKNKGSSSKEAPKTQLSPNPPLPPLPSPLGLHLDPNLQKKKRKEKEIEEGEIGPLKGSKQQKTNKDR